MGTVKLYQYLLILVYFDIFTVYSEKLVPITEIKYRKTLSSDFNQCIEIRSKTRQNPIPALQLASYGITAETQGPLFNDGTIVGCVAESDNEIIGFCSGHTLTGELLVLALLPEYEGLGIGKKLLQLVTDLLIEKGFKNLWLAASSNPEIRAHGFYRHLGWEFSGKTDEQGDQILELRLI